jgi:DNA-directed RNA polymerase I subunit RPA2
MIQKVYALAQGKIRPDNADALSTQEVDSRSPSLLMDCNDACMCLLKVLLPGHLYGSILKEKLIDWIAGIKGYIKKDIRLGAFGGEKTDASHKVCTLS